MSNMDGNKHFLVKHITSFQYSESIRELVIEVRKRPLDEETQHCLSFELDTHPASRLFGYQDHFGNHVHHFNMPQVQTHLNIVSESTVHMLPHRVIHPDTDGGTWDALDVARKHEAFYDWLHPSNYARPSEALLGFLDEVGQPAVDAPLPLLFHLQQAVHERLAYKPRSTDVDSPIEHALQQRAGVCQDFSHIMIAMARVRGIPARYVSGYLHHRTGDTAVSAEDASHAWVEAWLPELGWVGFDPTNNRLQDQHHIRVARGRDYQDVAPTRGIFRGKALETLSVGVSVFEIPEPIAKPCPPLWSKSQQETTQWTESDDPMRRQEQ